MKLLNYLNIKPISLTPEERARIIEIQLLHKEVIGLFNEDLTEAKRWVQKNPWAACFFIYQLMGYLGLTRPKKKEVK